jgi:HD-GYP domain-containing protein (c-di-GMP phosphodiesterase class II)
MVQVSKSRSVWIVALRFSPARHFGKADLGMMALARRMLLHQRQQLRAQERLKEALFGLVRGLVAAINAKNQYTSGHSERVARMAVCLGKQMGLRPPALGDLYLAGLLHDIGKIGIRSRVLQQAGPLSARDRAHIEEHPVIGDGIIASIQPLGHLRPGIRNHHERYDGQGYPDRLAGDDIPLMARILAVADAFDAMHSARPYREALPNDKIDAIMADGAGSQWDPEVIGHFMACRHDLHGICQKGIGDSVLVAVEQVVRAGDEDG